MKRRFASILLSMMLLATIVPVNGYALSIDELLRPFLSVI